jgi:hypothetical protein
MYAICYTTTPVNRDSIREEIEWCLKYGTYNAPRPSPLNILATSPDYYTAVRISASLAEREQRDIEVRSMTFNSGISDTPLHTSVPTPTPLHEEIDAALDAFDGVPADTKEGSQIR